MKLTYCCKKNDISIKQILKNVYQMSDRLILKLKNHKKIFVNGKCVHINYQINLNDKLEVYIDFIEDNSNIIPIKMDLDTLYEDEYMLILNKPSGLPVHPSMLHFDSSLSNGVKFYFDSIGLKKKIRPVNRLDKDTSGIVIFAKNEYIQESLVKQMKSNKFNKNYIAIINGTLRKKNGIINLPISRKSDSIIEREVNKNGDTAITEYYVIKEYNNMSLLYITLKTGRTHQIRVHFSYIGHPIVGDSLYGKPSPLINRQALHSCKISFFHPITNEHLIIESNIPQDILNVFK